MSKAALLIGGFLVVTGVIGLVTEAGAGGAVKMPNYCDVVTMGVHKCKIVSYICAANKRCHGYAQ